MVEVRRPGVLGDSELGRNLEDRAALLPSGFKPSCEPQGVHAFLGVGGWARAPLPAVWP